MPGTGPPTLPPGLGATGEEILRSMLPVVVDVGVKAAEGQTASAAAISALESRVAELTAQLAANTAEVKRVNDYRKAELHHRSETGQWLRGLLKPETVYYTLVLVATALGIRATIPAPVQVPLSTSGQVHHEPGDVP